MKIIPFIAIATVLLVAACVSQAPAQNNNNNPNTQPPANVNQPPSGPNFCGLTVVLTSPSPNEQVSGGFRVEWSVRNDGSFSLTNKQLNFTILMGENQLRKVTRYNSDSYKEDITFLSAVAKGRYNVTVTGQTGACILHPASVEINV
jgi:hypothetical protein